MAVRLYRFFAALTALLLMLPLCTISAAADGEKPPQHTYASALLEAESGMCIGGTDPDIPLPVGSQAKLMTVYLTARAVRAGELTPETSVTAPQAVEKQQGAVIWLTPGEHMTVLDLLKGVIIGNANDAAVTLASRISGSEQAFVMEMNAAASALGMNRTHFADCTGLSAENTASAHDLALLCRALLEFDFLTPLLTTWRDFLRDGKTELVAENTLTRTYEGILGMKAGHGEPCGYTLAAAAERGGLRMIAVILGCDDKDERFTLGKRLLAGAFSDIYVTTPDFAAEFLRPVPVRLGLTGAVTAEPGALRAVAAPKGRKISCVVILPEYVEAPVRQGETIGTAAFYCGDTYVYETPLTAAETVGKRHFADAARLLLSNMFK